MVRFAIGLLAFLFLAFSASSFGQAQKFQPFTFNDEQIRNLSPDERFKIERNVKLLGYKAYKNGNFLRALGFFKMAIQINPGNHFNYSHAAQSAIKIGKKEQAARFLKRAVTAAIKKNPTQKLKIIIGIFKEFIQFCQKHRKSAEHFCSGTKKIRNLSLSTEKAVTAMP